MVNFEEVLATLLKHADESANWGVISVDPVIVSKEALSNDEVQLLISLELLGEEHARLLLSTKGNEKQAELAGKILSLQEQSEINKELKGINFMVDTEGFTVYHDFNDLSAIQSAAEIESLIEQFEEVFFTLIEKAAEPLKEHGQGGVTDNDNTQTEALTENEQRTVPEVIESYFQQNGYESKHQLDNKRFITGFQTDNYVDKDSDDGVMVVIEYKDPALVRFRTPMLYKFDLDKTPYSLIASVIAWYQFKYKFLSLSLDPSDGELAISIDIPIHDAQLYESQVEIILNFIREFVDKTYKDLFNTLLTSPEDAQKALDEKMHEEKRKLAVKRWIYEQEDKIKSLSDEQREKLSETIDNLLAMEGI